jgi:hypothetical protein
MKHIVFIALLLGICLPQGLHGQALLSVASEKPATMPAVSDSDALVVTFEPAEDRSLPPLKAASELPVMSPELALANYERRAALQPVQLAAYSATTVIHAELPDSSQQGEFEVERKYNAPHTLLFKPIRFVGDKFVKSNIIARLLQSEVDHVEKDDGMATAISPANYKFSSKGRTEVQGRPVYVYQVRPHQKRVGLFKGRMYLDEHTGSLVRVEGSIVKSPSFFVNHIQFVQDYGDFDSFTLPVHIHSEAKARLVGRTIIDITHTNYLPVPAQTQAMLPTM